MGDETMRRTLYVGNLPEDITTKELNDEFRKFGRVVRCDIPMVGGRFKGFAFVEFEDYRDAKDAVYDMDGRRFGGRTLKVELSKRPPAANWNELSRRREERGSRDDDRRDRRRSPSPRGRGGRSPSPGRRRRSPSPSVRGGRARSPSPRGRPRSPSPRGGRRRSPTPPASDRKRSPTPKGRSRSRSGSPRK